MFCIPVFRALLEMRGLFGKIEHSFDAIRYIILFYISSNCKNRKTSSLLFLPSTLLYPNPYFSTKHKMVFSASIRGAMITRCITASMSTVASGLLAIFIWKSPTGLKSPYSRIIFGLSLADVLQSFGVLVAPFAAPKALFNIFGEGNEQSCEAIGFFTVMGSLAVPWYTLHLTYYFLKRVKYKITPKDFANGEEKWLHILIWTYSSAVAIYALARGQINPTNGGSMCYITASPVGCIDKECTRGVGANKTTAFTVIASLVTIFIALFLVLGAFSLHVYFSEKQLQPSKRKTKELTSLRKHKGALVLEDEESVQEKRKRDDSAEGNHEDEKSTEENHEDEESAQENREDAIEKYARQAMELVLTKSAIVQSSLYIFAFFFVYCGPIVGLAMGYRHSEIMFWWISIFYPLGGEFLIILCLDVSISQSFGSYNFTLLFRSI